MTFTNKATSEMKSRILDNLHKLASGESSEYLQGLIKATNQKEEWIRNEAGEILNSILNDYSRFSVSTIDSFFQKILRAFAREIGLHSGFSIELDHSLILALSVDEMIAAASNDKQMKNWLISYAISNIDEGKTWNLKNGIIMLAEELFKEEYKILSEHQRNNLEDKEFLLRYIEKIRSLSTSFEKKMAEYGNQAMMIYRTFDLTDDLFYRKGQGVPRFIRALDNGDIIAPNSYVREVMNNPPRWSTGVATPQLQAAIGDGLDNIVTEAIRFYDENIIEFNSAKVVLSNIFALGILSDVLYNIHKITTSENSFLLSDAGELLNLITSSNQSPFIYEKVGNRFETFMIDEFQDTSTIQWNNFWPLIDNSMAEGFDNLVVGDVKQSIYRWRNSDWKILGSLLKNQVDNSRFLSKPLTTNWRSTSNIISFNNTLFTTISEQIDEALIEEKLPVSFREIYSEAIQNDPGKKDGGYVRLEFIDDDGGKKWKDEVLKQLPGAIEKFQDKGYSASDIGIIVRDGREGASVLKTLIDYSNNTSPLNKSRYNYNIVSGDSLLLSNSHVINFIISVLYVLTDPSDMIRRASMLRFYLLAKGDKEADKIPLISKKLIIGSGSYFPDGYESFLEHIRQMPLFESVENIISFFGLGSFSWNVAYLNTFQDYVINYTGNRNSDIVSFLDWWETTGTKKSVILPGNQDAIRILTIHKSKGLEFKVVILPFLSWNMDHMPLKPPFLWVKPTASPFNELGILPVKYGKELNDTIFTDYYKTEKYSVYLDNINLLYVALTRAKDVIYAYSVNNPRSNNSISVILKNAISSDLSNEGTGRLNMVKYYNDENNVFEFGYFPENRRQLVENINITSSEYKVSMAMGSLKLKLHGENYFLPGHEEIRKKINYGKLMHEVFEGINTSSDISMAVRKLVFAGKLPAEEADTLEKRVSSLINEPPVKEWFMEGNKVMNEASILLTSGDIRRPDRIVFKDGKAVIIDFKFGEEDDRYIEQINLYRQLIVNMGYIDAEAYIWYVDKNKIITA